MSLGLFIAFGIIAVSGALGMVLSRNPVYGAVFLIATLISLAGEFLLLSSPFLALLQVLVYAGAIMVLYLFVIMLLNLGADADWRWYRSWRTYAAFALVAVVLVVALQTTGIFKPAAEQAYVTQDVQAIARVLFTDPMMIFIMQALGVLLLMSVIGAIYLSRRYTDEELAQLDAKRKADTHGLEPVISSDEKAKIASGGAS
jgi:NADH-quinone oxidoreductase subunit J